MAIETDYAEIEAMLDAYLDRHDEEDVTTRLMPTRLGLIRDRSVGNHPTWTIDDMAVGILDVPTSLEPDTTFSTVARYISRTNFLSLDALFLLNPDVTETDSAKRIQIVVTESTVLDGLYSVFRRFPSGSYVPETEPNKAEELRSRRRLFSWYKEAGIVDLDFVDPALARYNFTFLDRK